MNLNLTIHASIASYQIYAYQERVVSTLWKKVGDVKALDLPMACDLTQFSKGNKYHFAVRARDCHSRVGNFSDPLSISFPTANLVGVNRGTTVLQTPVAILQSKKPTLQMTPVMKHPAPLPDPPKFQISGQNM